MALAEIGQPGTAVRMLEEGMAERTEDYARDTALGMAAIADAQLSRRDLDGALDTARRAAELVSRIGSSRVVDQLRAFAGKLPAGEPEAEEFRHYLDSLRTGG
ncbi:hypothetical protein [Nonomuraea basaltis]|uniref:hypothetical protein n=1 Tax=Nonomuraea basaltis TaxID=2495887 RepID=UPI00110C4B4F|nr:hypothetical protein [Nonomuraea basaltis]TMR92691.1 hypothetical protein EJK15_43220 [Nonomuraea basaltis]